MIVYVIARTPHAQTIGFSFFQNFFNKIIPQTNSDLNKYNINVMLANKKAREKSRFFK